MWTWKQEVGCDGFPTQGTMQDLSLGIVQIKHSIWVKTRLMPILFQKGWSRKYGDATTNLVDCSHINRHKILTDYSLNSTFYL